MGALDASWREKMEEVIAGLQGFTFTFEHDVELQKGTGLLPFQDMDSEWQRPSSPAQVLRELSSRTSRIERQISEFPEFPGCPEPNLQPPVSELG